MNIMGQGTRVENNNEVFLRVNQPYRTSREKSTRPGWIRTATFGLLVQCSTNSATGQVGSWSSNDGIWAISYFQTDPSFFHT